METNKKDPFNLGYFLLIMAVLLLPTLPATLTWLAILNR